MNEKFTAKMLDKRFIVTAITMILFISSLEAVASQRGKQERSRDLQKQIESSQVLPDHKYYYSGGAGKPGAILGIHKDYQLVTGQWQGVQISSEQLMKWMSQISPDTTMGAGGYAAFYIIAPDGKKAGFWYSFQSMTTVKFPGGNSIEVYPPELDQPAGELEEMVTPPELDIEAEDMDLDIDD